MPIFRLPTLKKVARLYDHSRFPAINGKILAIKCASRTEKGGLLQFKRELDIGEYFLQLHYRLLDAGRSFSFMSYFYSLGIPDEEWHISPGKRGQSIEYFPHFRPIHHLIKDWFDYYEDFFLAKVFSALEMVGQILNAYFDFGLAETQVSFLSSLKSTQSVNPQLYKRLAKVSESDPFKKASMMRNSGTHRRLTSCVGMAVSNPKKGLYQFGVTPYFTTTEVMRISDELATGLDAVASALSDHLL